MNRMIPWAALGLVALAGCGQKGPLYLPDRGGTIVTRPASSNSPAASTPAQTPAGQQTTPATATPTAPKDKDPDDTQSPK
jgi:predicted small lipoprotein YifL